MTDALVPDQEVTIEAVETKETLIPVPNEPDTVAYDTSKDSGLESTPPPWYSDLKIDLSEYENENKEELKVKMFNVLNKFKNPAEMIKSYSDMESAYTKVNSQAPDEYRIPTSEEYGLEINREMPMVQMLEEWARNSKMPQETFTGALNLWKEMKLAEIPDPAVEMKSLGANYEMESQIMSQWIENNFTPEESNLMKEFATTADRFRVLQKTRNIVVKSQQTIPEQQQAAEFVAPVSTLDDVAYTDIEKNYDRYINDEVYRNHVIEKMARASS